MKNIKPFKIFCKTIGNLPTSYQVSLTYEEQLILFEKFIREEIIPELNLQGEAITELQNYFDNLNVQNEIDHKLEEMADSGELVEVIATFLNLNSILAFNTVAEMVASTSLVDGSVCKTLGNENFNDGEGELYKIVQDETLTADDIDIIALGRDNLFAVKINHPKIIDDMETLESQTTNAPSINAVKDYTYSKDDVYTKTEADTTFESKEDLGDNYYNKTESDGKFATIEGVTEFQEETVTATATRNNCTQELTATFRRVGNVVTVKLNIDVVSTDSEGGLALISFTSGESTTGFTHIDIPNFAKTNQTDSENSIILGYFNNYIGTDYFTNGHFRKSTTGNYMFSGTVKFSPDSAVTNQFAHSFTYLIDTTEDAA